MPTTRSLTRRAYQCGLYEAQDVLRQIDDVDLLHVEPGRWFSAQFPLHKRLLYRDVSRKLIFRNPGLRRIRLNREYELFVSVCQSFTDLIYLSALDGWRDYCETCVCWIDEVWAAQIPLYEYWMDVLRRFDHIFVGFLGSVDPLSKALGRKCHWLPGGVDTIRFSPYPNPPERVIDVYSIGRRWEGIHESLLGAADSKRTFYIYDTILQAAELEPYDHRRHRDLFANMAKRSRYFMVGPAKMNLPKDTQGQVELGYRYFEGSAAGAIMIGQVPDCEGFREMFPWQDVVVPLQPDGSDVTDILNDLDSQAERRSRMSRSNAVEALLRHDWMYRWKEILNAVGLSPSPALLERERCLGHRAALARMAQPAAECRA